MLITVTLGDVGSSGLLAFVYGYVTFLLRIIIAGSSVPMLPREHERQQGIFQSHIYHSHVAIIELSWAESFQVLPSFSPE